jgi:hypothetical protein
LTRAPARADHALVNVATSTLSTPEGAALLERGYPHLLVLEDGHPDDAAPERAAAKVVDAVDPIYFVRWPAKVTLRFCRAMGKIGKTGESKKAVAELSATGQLDAKEARAILMHATLDVDHAYPFHFTGLVYGLEALVGTDATLAGLTAAFEALAKDAKSARHKSRYSQSRAAIAAGFLLRRASPKVASPARKALEKAAATPREVPALEELALVLGGRAALAKSGYTWTPPATWLFDDDPAFVREAIRTAKGEVAFDARGVWLGGEEILDLYTKAVKKTPLARVPYVVESLAMFRSPRVVPLMELLAAKRGGEDAKRWLSSPAAKAGGPAAASAKAAKPKAKVSPNAKAEAPAPARPKRPRRSEIESAFDALIDQVVREMKGARGKPSKEADVLRAAAARYAEIRGWWDTDTTAYMTHFFAADGLALQKQRKSAWERLKPSAAEGKRWLSVLEAESN